MFAWFSFKKPDVRLHLRPPVIEEHKRELGGYALPPKFLDRLYI
jgi:hypothetical protein